MIGDSLHIYLPDLKKKTKGYAYLVEFSGRRAKKVKEYKITLEEIKNG